MCTQFDWVFWWKLKKKNKKKKIKIFWIHYIIGFDHKNNQFINNWFGYWCIQFYNDSYRSFIQSFFFLLVFQYKKKSKQQTKKFWFYLYADGKISTFTYSGYWSCFQYICCWCCYYVHFIGILTIYLFLTPSLLPIYTYMEFDDGNKIIIILIIFDIDSIFKILCLCNAFVQYFHHFHLLKVSNKFSPDKCQMIEWFRILH